MNSKEEESEAFFFKTPAFDLTGKVWTNQYPANEPVEDRIVTQTFKVIRGNVTAVLDGHGGHQVADYVSKALAPVLEYYILRENELERRVDQEDNQGRSIVWEFGDEKRKQTSWDVYKEDMEERKNREWVCKYLLF